MSDWQKFLIAVNETEVAMRAVKYVGEMMNAVKVTSICLLHVFPDPQPDFYQKGGTLEQYKEEMEEQGKKIMVEASKMLQDFGFPEESIAFEIRMAEGLTISKAIIAEQKKHGCGTVVVGKRGLCKAEEFLFGSISNALARESRDFTTWVVG